MKKKIDYKKQGKRNRAAGQRFEARVRKDLESKGWFVSKWQNNVELEYDLEVLFKKVIKGKCIPAKMGKFRSNQGGYPDFLCYCRLKRKGIYKIIFVESKSKGYLSKEEKMKAKWYLENDYCSKFLIASKGKKRGVIEYKEFK